MISEPISVLSLFDGMSCGQIALGRAGVPVENYFASEIDKWAMAVTQTNYPSTIQLGDVGCWKEWNLPKIDLLIGGSPCQGFSYAGKQLNFEDPRSKLFFEFVDVLNNLRNKNPNILFLLENVKMKKEWADTISRLLNVDYIQIDSSLVSAQRRKRFYWTNIPNVTPPKDRLITIDSILERKNMKEFQMSESFHRWFYKNKDFLLRKKYVGVDGEKSNTFTFRNYKSWNSHYITMDNGKLRRFSPTEVERLQTVPDNYTISVPEQKRYDMLGNGWTIDVLAHIFMGIK